MREIFKLGDREIALFLSVKDGGFRLHVGNDVFAVEAGEGQVALDGHRHAVDIAAQGDRLFVHLEGQAYEVDHLPAVLRHAGDAAGAASDHLVAPMPGVMIACAVKPGDTVAEGDLLLVIESMKLETPFKAWRAGRVENVHVVLGQAFERDRVLLSLEAA